MRPRIRWDKVDKNLYRQTVEERLVELKLNLNTEEEIQHSFETINSILVEAATKSAPPYKTKRKKPKLQIRTPEIVESIKKKKQAQKNWRNNGRPRDPVNQLFIQRKQTTIDLRRECRLAIAKQRMIEREEIMNARQTDMKTFYRLIRKQRGSSKFILDDLNVNGDLFRTQEQIIEGWHQHFAALAKAGQSDKFDMDHLNIVDIEYEQIISICQANRTHTEISLEEIDKAIQNLNRNKAPDCHGLTAENLLYGGQIIVKYLQQLIDRSYELCFIPNSLKVGTLTPIYKNKGDKKEAKNYRGITITPILSKIIEIVMKFRIKPRITEIQNGLQRGFTEKASPLYSALIMEEVRRENLDLKVETIFVLLDAKSAFDVVRHTNMIRKLYHYGIDDQIILMIDNLYRDAVTYVKWNGENSAPFNIEQGVRQGGTLSADLYKIYVNQLLDELCTSQAGGRIGDINCCAPACADDITLVASTPQDAQILIDIATDYSHREAYHLQPTKSVVLHNNKDINKVEYNLEMDGNQMPLVNKATHIGVMRSSGNSAIATAEENVKKARRAMYSMMASGLHGENGLDPTTATSMFRTYVLPILLYGVEIVLPKGKALEMMDKFHKKAIKQILSLTSNVADPAVYILSGLLPLEAEFHVKVVNFFGNIARSDNNSLEWKIAERQLAVKQHTSHSWFIELKKIFYIYGITDIENYLHYPLGKEKWKTVLIRKIKDYWKEKLLRQKEMYSSLNYLSSNYHLGKTHPIVNLPFANPSDIPRIATRLKIVTGTYLLQTNRAAFSKSVKGTCQLCDDADETLEHFLLACKKLMNTRQKIMTGIIEAAARVFAKVPFSNEINLIQLIMDPFYYTITQKDLVQEVQTEIEPHCRRLIYALHTEKYKTFLDMKRCQDTG